MLSIKLLAAAKKPKGKSASLSARSSAVCIKFLCEREHLCNM